MLDATDKQIEKMWLKYFGIMHPKKQDYGLSVFLRSDIDVEEARVLKQTCDTDGIPYDVAIIMYTKVMDEELVGDCMCN